MKKALIPLLLIMALLAGCTAPAPQPTQAAPSAAPDNTAAPTPTPVPTPSLSPSPSPSPSPAETPAPDPFIAEISAYVRMRLEYSSRLPEGWDGFSIMVSDETVSVSDVPCREIYVYGSADADAPLLYTFAAAEDMSRMFTWDEESGGFKLFGKEAPSDAEEVGDALKDELLKFAEHYITGAGDPLPAGWEHHGFIVPSGRKEVKGRGCYIIYVTDEYKGRPFTVMQLAAASDYTALYLYDGELGQYVIYPPPDSSSDYARTSELIGYIEEFLRAQDQLPEEWGDYQYAVQREKAKVGLKECSIVIVYAYANWDFAEKMRFAIPDDYSTLYRYNSATDTYVDMDF